MNRDPEYMRKLVLRIQAANQLLHDGDTDFAAKQFWCCPIAVCAGIPQTKWRDRLQEIRQSHLVTHPDDCEPERLSQADVLQHLMIELLGILESWQEMRIQSVRAEFSTILDQRCYRCWNSSPDEEWKNVRKEARPPGWERDEFRFAVTFIPTNLIERIVLEVQKMNAEGEELVPIELRNVLNGKNLEILSYLWPKKTVKTDSFWRDLWSDSQNLEAARQAVYRLNKRLEGLGFHDISVDPSTSTVTLNYGRFAPKSIL
jgi:hypothetical protein